MGCSVGQALDIFILVCVSESYNVCHVVILFWNSIFETWNEEDLPPLQLKELKANMMNPIQYLKHTISHNLNGKQYTNEPMIIVEVIMKDPTARKSCCGTTGRHTNQD